MYLTKSINGKIIRLTNERWVHIVEGHPEMAGSLNEILLAVAEPELILMGGNHELLACIYKQADKLLVVVYKEEGDDGFIITAFFTKRIKQILKREISWQKSVQKLSSQDLEELLGAT